MGKKKKFQGNHASSGSVTSTSGSDSESSTSYEETTSTEGESTTTVTNKKSTKPPQSNPRYDDDDDDGEEEYYDEDMKTGVTGITDITDMSGKRSVEEEVTQEETEEKPQEKTQDDDQDAQETIKKIETGDYDPLLISAFRCNFFDLRQLTSGIDHKHRNSIFHRVARFLGLDDKNNEIAGAIRRKFVFNRERIRDRLDSCDCCDGQLHYTGKLTDLKKDSDLGSGDTKLRQRKIATSMMLQRIVKVDIPDYKPSLRKPPPLPQGDVSEPEPEQEPEFEPPKKLSTKTTSLLSDDYDQKQLNIGKTDNTIQGKLTDAQRNDVMAGKQLQFVCPQCNYKGNTKVQYKLGGCAYLTIVALTMFCLLPCAMCACMNNSLRDALHICPECHYILGIVRKQPCGRSLQWDWENDRARMPDKFRKKSRRSMAMRQSLAAANQPMPSYLTTEDAGTRMSIKQDSFRRASKRSTSVVRKSINNMGFK